MIGLTQSYHVFAQLQLQTIRVLLRNQRKRRKKRSMINSLRIRKEIRLQVKFITLHKTDGKLYLELPLKYLKQQMLLSGAVSSSTDPTYVAVGMKNSNPLYFYFDIQDSSVVMKTPNTVLYNNGKESNELKRCFQLELS